MLKGKPAELFPKFWKEMGVTQLCFEEDTEPYGKERDDEIRKLAKKAGKGFFSTQLCFPWLPIPLNAGASAMIPFNHISI